MNPDKPLLTSHSRGSLQRSINQMWPTLGIILLPDGKLEATAKPETDLSKYKWDNKNGRFRLMYLR